MLNNGVNSYIVGYSRPWHFTPESAWCWRSGPWMASVGVVLCKDTRVQEVRISELFQVGLVFQGGNTLAKLIDLLLLGERENAL